MTTTGEMQWAQDEETIQHLLSQLELCSSMLERSNLECSTNSDPQKLSRAKNLGARIRRLKAVVATGDFFCAEAKQRQIDELWGGCTT
eukprot:3330113-Rhodomonas_salina.1